MKYFHWLIAFSTWILLTSTMARGEDFTANAFGQLVGGIPLPQPAFRGLEPKLGLNYSSAARNGWMGMGWKLNATSVITLGGKDGGFPKLDGTDAFYLDGEKLIPCRELGGTHCTETQNYQRIVYNSDQQSWVITDGAGTARHYDYVLAQNGQSIRWMLSEVKSLLGQRVQYEYWCDELEECYPDRIVYNGTEIRFHRELRPDIYVEAFGFGIKKVRYRLAALSTQVGGQYRSAYRFTYKQSAASQRSLLTTIQYFGSDVTLDDNGVILGGTEGSPIQLSYQDDALKIERKPLDFPAQVYMAMNQNMNTQFDPSTDGGAQFADFDGDGVKDLIWLHACPGVMDRKSCVPKREIWLRKNESWVAGPTPPGEGYIWIQRFSPTGELLGLTPGGVQIADFNGDGKADIMEAIRTPAAAQAKIWLGTGSGFTNGPAVPDSVYFVMPRFDAFGQASPFQDGGLRLVDLNADSKMDLLWSLQECDANYGQNGCQVHQKTWLSTDEGFVIGPQLPSELLFAIPRFDSTGSYRYADDAGVRVEDMNADGYPEFLMAGIECWTAGSCTNRRGSWTFDGEKFVPWLELPKELVFHLPVFDTAGFGREASQDAGVRIGDINGDGRPDFLQALRECGPAFGSGCQSLRKSWIFKGDGWEPGPALPPGFLFAAPRYQTPTMSVSQATGAQLGDLNHDGIADILASGTFCADESTQSCQKMKAVWYGGSEGFRPGENLPETMEFAGPVLSVLGQALATTDNGFRLFDVNGDDTLDFIRSFKRCLAPAGCQSIQFAFIVQLGQDLLTSIRHSQAGDYEFAYRPARSWPNQILPAEVSFPTLSALTRLDAVRQSYKEEFRFEGGLWSFADRKFLGFSRKFHVGDALGTEVETQYVLKTGLIGLPHRVYTRSKSGQLYRYTENTYQALDRAPYRAAPVEVWSFYCIADSTCRKAVVQSDIDAYGNVVEQRDFGNWEVQGDETTTVTVYHPNLDSYLVRNPAEKNVYEGIGASERLLSREKYLYDDQADHALPAQFGLLTTTQVWDNISGGYRNLTTKFDAYGNAVEKRDGEGRLLGQSKLDPVYHIYEVERCSENNVCVSSVWDTVLGSVLDEYDRYKNKTSYRYDPLGRLIRKDLPDGSYAEYTYALGENSAEETYTEERQFVDGKVYWTRSYLDSLQRPWKKVRHDGVITEIEYQNFSDLVKRRSAPYKEGETVYWTEMTYDAIGRLLTQTNPDTTTVENVYGLDYVASYDALGREKISWFDIAGNTIQIDERNGDEIYTTHRKYDSIGRLIEVRDDLKHTTTITYDSLGQRREICEATKACVTFVYDRGGKIVLSTMKDESTVRYEYDGQGRLLLKKASDGTFARYDYDEEGHFGRTDWTSVEDQSGKIKRYFDSVGRLVRLQRCILQKCYDFGFTYSQGQRMQSMRYPNGETISYEYDEVGRLAKIPGLVKEYSYNTRDQLTSLTYENGVRNEYAYDAVTGLLDHAAFVADDKDLFAADYEYDLADQLTRSTSSTHDEANLGYKYDDLSRLLEVTGGQQQTFTYDRIGNISSNSKQGSYAYEDQRNPYAVTKAGTRIYKYDALGRMIESDGRKLDWNGFDQLKSLVDKSGTTRYLYDFDGFRTHSKGPASESFYFSSYLEVKDGKEIYQYFGGATLLARREANETFFYHQDRLGSTRLITDSRGKEVSSYDYEAYGKIIKQKGAHVNPIGFTGHRHDASGLIYMNARYYDPELGRFISADSLVPDLDNPQALNRYSYVLNNPVSAVDPSGHWGISVKSLTKGISDGLKHIGGEISKGFKAALPYIIVAVAVALAVTGIGAVASGALMTAMQGLAIFGGVTTAVGIATRNRSLIAAGGVILGVASGFAFGAGFGLAAGTWQAAAVGGGMSWYTSDFNHNADANTKRNVGYAYALAKLVKPAGESSMSANRLEGQKAGIEAAKEKPLAMVDDYIAKSEAQGGAALDKATRDSIFAGRTEWGSKWAENYHAANSDATGHWWQSEGHQAFGRMVESHSGGGLTAEEAMRLSPSGGVIGPDFEWMGVHKVLGTTAVGQHALSHDSAGFLGSKELWGSSQTWEIYYHDTAISPMMRFGMIWERRNPLNGQITGLSEQAFIAGCTTNLCMK